MDDVKVQVTVLFTMAPVTTPVLVMLAPASHSKHTRSKLSKPVASPIKLRVKFIGTCTAVVVVNSGLTSVDT